MGPFCTLITLPYLTTLPRFGATSRMTHACEFATVAPCYSCPTPNGTFLPFVACISYYTLPDKYNYPRSLYTLATRRVVNPYIIVSPGSLQLVVNVG